MGILDWIEYCLGRLFFNIKRHDDKLFIKGPAFTNFPEPNITIDSPDCGPSNSIMKIEYSAPGGDRFPELEWSPHSTIATDVQEYILVVQDPDAPLPIAPTHGIYYAIPASVTKVTASHITFDKASSTAMEKKLNAPFKLGKNLRGTIYGGPRPILGHGPHRYFYQVIALKEPVNIKNMSAMATKKELAAEIVGKVAGWGAWIGVYERKWE